MGDLSAHYVQHLLEIPEGRRIAERLQDRLSTAQNGATVPDRSDAVRGSGFEVQTTVHRPTAGNINLDCGSTPSRRPGEVQSSHAVRASEWRFDGDGDRALFVDHTGKIVDGDAILLMAAIYLKDRGKLPGPGSGRHRDEQHRPGNRAARSRH
jgi:phosphoglucosamine mutase